MWGSWSEVGIWWQGRRVALGIPGPRQIPSPDDFPNYLFFPFVKKKKINTRVTPPWQKNIQLGHIKLN